jgi:hypothetical protein
MIFKLLLFQAELIEESLTEKIKQAAKLRDKSLELESKVREASLKAENTVRETQDWVEVFTKEDKRNQFNKNKK